MSLTGGNQLPSVSDTSTPGLVSDRVYALTVSMSSVVSVGTSQAVLSASTYSGGSCLYSVASLGSTWSSTLVVSVAPDVSDSLSVYMRCSGTTFSGTNMSITSEYSINTLKAYISVPVPIGRTATMVIKQNDGLVT